MPALSPVAEPRHRTLGRRRRRRLGQRAAKDIAKRNLIWSIFAEHVGFSIWSIWSVMVLFMPQNVYGIDAAGKFYLVAVPTLVGAFMRIPYTIAPAKLRRPQLDHRQRAVAAHPDAADAVLR